MIEETKMPALISEEALDRNLKMRSNSQKFWFAATWIFGAMTLAIPFIGDWFTSSFRVEKRLIGNF